MDDYEQAVHEAAEEAANGNAKVQNKLIAYGKQLNSLETSTNNYTNAQKQLDQSSVNLAEKMSTVSNSTLNYGQAILSAASMIGGVVTAVNSVKSVWETITDPDLSG